MEEDGRSRHIKNKDRKRKKKDMKKDRGGRRGRQEAGER